MNTLPTFLPNELEQLMGQRDRILAQTKCLKLAHSGIRLVCYSGMPLGIVQHISTMIWVSPRRHYFYSLADASIDVVGWCWRAYEEGGLPALRQRIADARKEARRLGAEIEEAAE